MDVTTPLGEHQDGLNAPFARCAVQRRPVHGGGAINADVLTGQQELCELLVALLARIVQRSVAIKVSRIHISTALKGRFNRDLSLVHPWHHGEQKPRLFAFIMLVVVGGQFIGPLLALLGAGDGVQIALFCRTEELAVFVARGNVPWQASGEGDQARRLSCVPCPVGCRIFSALHFSTSAVTSSIGGRTAINRVLLNGHTFQRLTLPDECKLVNIPVQ